MRHQIEESKYMGHSVRRPRPGKQAVRVDRWRNANGALGNGWQGPQEGKLSISEQSFPIYTRKAGAIRDLIRRPYWVGDRSEEAYEGQSRITEAKKNRAQRAAG